MLRAIKGIYPGVPAVEPIELVAALGDIRTLARVRRVGAVHDAVGTFSFSLYVLLGVCVWLMLVLVVCE
jgi:hypothetical protein